MYLAQATGSHIVTDNRFRWRELQKALTPNIGTPILASVSNAVQNARFTFPQDVVDVERLAANKHCALYPPLMQAIFKYLQNFDDRGIRPNREAQLTSRFVKLHGPAQTAIHKSKVLFKNAKISCAFPHGGIQDNTVNRLLLMSSSETHLPNVPMAFFIEEDGTN